MSLGRCNLAERSLKFLPIFRHADPASGLLEPLGLLGLGHLSSTLRLSLQQLLVHLTALLGLSRVHVDGPALAPDSARKVVLEPARRSDLEASRKRQQQPCPAPVEHRRARPVADCTIW